MFFLKFHPRKVFPDTNYQTTAHVKWFLLIKLLPTYCPRLFKVLKFRKLTILKNSSPFPLDQLIISLYPWIFISNLKFGRKGERERNKRGGSSECLTGGVKLIYVLGLSQRLIWLRGWAFWKSGALFTVIFPLRVERSFRTILNFAVLILSGRMGRRGKTEWKWRWEGIFLSYTTFVV